MVNESINSSYVQGPAGKFLLVQTDILVSSTMSPAILELSMRASTRPSSCSLMSDVLELRETLVRITLANGYACNGPEGGLRSYGVAYWDETHRAVALRTPPPPVSVAAAEIESSLQDDE